MLTSVGVFLLVLVLEIGETKSPWDSYSFDDYQRDFGKKFDDP